MDHIWLWLCHIPTFRNITLNYQIMIHPYLVGCFFAEDDFQQHSALVNIFMTLNVFILSHWLGTADRVVTALISIQKMFGSLTVRIILHDSRTVRSGIRMTIQMILSSQSMRFIGSWGVHRNLNVFAKPVIWTT